MSEGTDKVGRSGRFGARYGTSVRRRLELVEEQQFSDHRCPQCLTGDLDRVSTSIWQCRKCDHKFAGGAYVPQTAVFGKARASAEEIAEFEEGHEEELEVETTEPSEQRKYGEPEPEDLVATEEDETAMDEVVEEDEEAEDEDEDEDEDEGIESLFE